MRQIKLLLGVAAGVVLSAAILCTTWNQTQAARTQKKPKSLLVVTVTKGFRHDSIATAEMVIEKIGKDTGDWTTDFARTDEDIKNKMTPDALNKYDGVVFANTTGVLPLPDHEALLKYVASGKGFSAMHSGSDTYHTWPGGASDKVSAYIDMLGGEFETHGAQCAVMGNIENPKHPAMKGVMSNATKVEPSALAAMDVRAASATDGKFWKVYDEIYILKNCDPAKLHTLLWLDKHPDDRSSKANKPGTNLLAWTKAYGKGKVFYTALGHRKEVWNDPLYQAHVRGGIRFTLGLEKGDVKPQKMLVPYSQ